MVWDFFQLLSLKLFIIILNISAAAFDLLSANSSVREIGKGYFAMKDYKE